MRANIILLAAFSMLLLAAFPAFAGEADDASSEEGEKTVIIKITSDGDCTEISSSDGKECEIILDCEGFEDLEGLCEGEEGIKKIIIKCPDGECPDMGKFEMDFDIDLGEAGLSGEKTTITMIVDDDGEEVTIKARGDKEKLKPEIDEMLKELGEDGGKVTTKELEDGYDITITK